LWPEGMPSDGIKGAAPVNGEETLMATTRVFPGCYRAPPCVVGNSSRKPLPQSLSGRVPISRPRRSICWILCRPSRAHPPIVPDKRHCKSVFLCVLSVFST
jgi:hypothetical protein